MKKISEDLNENTPPIICSNRAMARKASRVHKSALQSPCGCRVERLDAKDVPERQCVCGYPNKRV